jgi:hypothetical protein
MRFSRIDFNQVIATVRITQVGLGQREYFMPLEFQFTCEKKEAKLMLIMLFPYDVYCVLNNQQ